MKKTIDATFIEGKKLSDAEICPIFGVLPQPRPIHAGKAALLAIWAVLLGVCFSLVAVASPRHALPKWVRVKDAFRVHHRYVVPQADGTQVVLGEFYEVEPGDFVGVCYGGDPQTFATELRASEYVLGCEVWGQ